MGFSTFGGMANSRRVQHRSSVLAASGAKAEDEYGRDKYIVRPYVPGGGGGQVGMFGGRGSLTTSSASSISMDRELSDVLIEAPSMQSRRISATIMVDGEVDEVWKVLTDYNNLAVHVPNLVQSYVVMGGRGGMMSAGALMMDNGGRLKDDDGEPIVTDVRIFQEGAQKILGFDFRASLKMDMTAAPTVYSPAGGGGGEERREVTSRRLNFKLADSFMFSAFDGSWTVGAHSQKQLRSGEVVSRSQLTYSVLVRPRGPVPVAALEWRIKEDVPVNLRAVKKAVETKAYYKLRRGPALSAFNQQSNKASKGRTVTRLNGSGGKQLQQQQQGKKGKVRSVPKPNSTLGLGTGGPNRSKGNYWDADETLENYLA